MDVRNPHIGIVTSNICDYPLKKMTLSKRVRPFKALALKTMQSRAVTVTLVLSWIMMSLYYYNVFNIVGYGFSKEYDMRNISNDSTNRVKEDYLIDTPGCKIQNYSRTIKFNKVTLPNPSCGIRAVYVKKIGDKAIEFTIHKRNMESYNKRKGPYECSYRFVSRSTVVGREDTELYYTPPKRFWNGTRIPLEKEVITATCYATSKNTKAVPIYEDSYMFVRKVKKLNGKKGWNVLLLSMDTMSRSRAFSSMPATVKYLQRNQWLDYRAYQKVAFNTFPNLMSVMTGKKMATIYRACAEGISSCNDLMMWSRYQEAGYATAYGEDYLRLPDTFQPYKGFKTPPTDHYMRPLFLTTETQNGGTICTRKLPSGKHMLNYAADFAKAYKSDNFFGLFWMNSYSHNLANVPTLIDETMVELFEKLNSTGVLNNTFVVFFSDHGIRFGETRYQYESYYEERLPMLFLWVPEQFRRTHVEEYASAVTNQQRLVTPYDLHMTLQEILKLSNPEVSIEGSEACPDCTSLFQDKSVTRTCSDAKVDEKWCSCHNMKRVNQSDVDAKACLHLAVSHIQNISQSVQTTDCMKCHSLTLKTVLRIHLYVNEIVNRVYYVVAFVMQPGNVAYEINMFKENNSFEIISPTETISAYNERGNCVKHPAQRGFCVCDKVPCNK